MAWLRQHLLHPIPLVPLPLLAWPQQPPLHLILSVPPQPRPLADHTSTNRARTAPSERALASAGRWAEFRSAFARIVAVDGPQGHGVTINADGADTLGVRVGDSIDWIGG